NTIPRVKVLLGKQHLRSHWLRHWGSKHPSKQRSRQSLSQVITCDSARPAAPKTTPTIAAAAHHLAQSLVRRGRHDAGLFISAPPGFTLNRGSLINFSCSPRQSSPC